MIQKSVAILFLSCFAIFLTGCGASQEKKGASQEEKENVEKAMDQMSEIMEEDPGLSLNTCKKLETIEVNQTPIDFQTAWKKVLIVTRKAAQLESAESSSKTPAKTAVAQLKESMALLAEGLAAFEELDEIAAKYSQKYREILEKRNEEMKNEDIKNNKT